MDPGSGDQREIDYSGLPGKTVGMATMVDMSEASKPKSGFSSTFLRFFLYFSSLFLAFLILFFAFKSREKEKKRKRKGKEKRRKAGEKPEKRKAPPLLL